MLNLEKFLIEFYKMLEMLHQLTYLKRTKTTHLLNWKLKIKNELYHNDLW